MAHSYSIVEYCGYQKDRECGYCKGPDTNSHHGMWTHYLTVQDYQDLMDRGWRRCGCYCYKPTMNLTCCPMYTIRCDALNFKVSKSQKKILKKMAKFLRNELQRGKEMEDSRIDTPDNIDKSSIDITNYAEHCAKAQDNISEMKVESIEDTLERRCDVIPVKERKEKKQDEPLKKEIASPQCHKEKPKIQKAGEDPNRPPPKKAKLIRVEKKMKKLLAQGKSSEEIESLVKGSRENVAKSIEELFNEIHGGVKKLEIKLLSVLSDEFMASLDVTAKLYKKYQTVIHKSELDQCDKESFINFLVKSPLQHESPPDGPPQGYGSFHEQYWLDGQLLAVAVLDILPYGVSSVYFFYDPDYSFLSLGNFSSLREVCLTRQLNKTTPRFKYYYMGFYINSNAKMRYKAKIRPSELLCPESYTWCDLDRSIAKINKEKYSRLNEDIDAVDQNGFVDIQTVLVLHRHRAMPYALYPKQNEDNNKTVREYSNLVGMKCARSMLLYRK